MLLVRWVHVLAMTVWLGGMLFIALVVVPVTRGLPDPALRSRLVQQMGRRFRTIGWAALAVLVATGLVNLWQAPHLLRAGRFHWKLGLVVLALLLSVYHDFVVGPRAGQPGADPSARVRAAWIARLNVLLVLVIVFLGVTLR